MTGAVGTDPVFHARRTTGVEIAGARSAVVGRRVGESGGVFAEWSWTGERLEGRTDRFGFQPLFGFASADEVALSPSIGELLSLGAPRELDDDALSVFLRLGTFLADETPFLAIRALSADTRFRWTPGRGLETSGGTEIASTALDLDEDALVDELASRFRNSVARHLEGSTVRVLPLSGGRDSRHILLEMLAAGVRPEECVTVPNLPPIGSDDARIAAELCTAAGVKHVIVDWRPRLLAEERRKNRLTGLCALEHTWLLALRDHLLRHRGDSLDGIAGDVLSESKNLLPERVALFAAGKLATLAEELLGPEALESLLSLQARARWPRSRAVTHLTEELARHRRAPNPFGSFQFWNRTRRTVALSPFRILAGALDSVLAPYLDHDLVGFLSAVPASRLMGTEIHTKAIRRAHPRFAHIPFARASSAADERGLLSAFSRDVVRELFKRRGTVLDPWGVGLRAARSAAFTRWRSEISWVGSLAVYLLDLEDAQRSIP